MLEKPDDGYAGWVVTTKVVAQSQVAKEVRLIDLIDIRTRFTM